MNEEQSAAPAGNEVAAGTPEGVSPNEPSSDEIAELYKATGVKAPVPTGKRAGRPKTANVRAENGSKNGAGNSNSGQEGNDDDEGDSKNARSSGKNGDSGNGSNSSGSKKQSDSGKVQDESEEADAGVRGEKSRSKSDSERGSEDDSGDGAEGTGRAADDEGSEEGEGEDAEKGKRPGKSNPEVEKRIQRLNAEKKAAEDRAAKLEKQLQEREQQNQKAKIAEEDPEYTVDDFRKVQDRDGNILELDRNQAELAWRRWKDGYDQRAEERNAAANREQTMTEQREEHTRALMKQSADAYDALAGLMDDYPELVSTSGKFDAEFAKDAMPIIQEAIQYAPGTEPGNAEDNLPVIVGLKIHPKRILDALKSISNKKRSLPLNGTRDNVESGSNVGVPHTRSSDPTVNAANQLYKELGIDKRI